MTSLTVLITCVGGDFGPELIFNFRACNRYEIRVIGVDQNSETSARYHCDCFFSVPPGSSKQYASRILEIVENYNVDFVLPTSDDEALSLSKIQDKFEQNGCVLACVAHSLLSVFSDKFETHKRLQELDIYTPHLRYVVDSEDLEPVVVEMLEKYGEIVLKPSVARGGRGVLVIRKDLTKVERFMDRREIHLNLNEFLASFLAEYKNNCPIIVMERLLEPVYDLDMLAWKGSPIRMVPRRRVNSAVPNDGHTVVGNQELIDLGERLIKGFNLSWLYDCDIMYHASGKPCVLEINPRPSGSMVVSISAGIPLVEDLISVLMGEKVEECVLPVGTQVVPYKSLFKVPAV